MSRPGKPHASLNAPPDTAQSHSYVLIVDEAIASFMAAQHITDPNAYMVKLLQNEKQRQTGQPPQVQSRQ